MEIMSVDDLKNLHDFLHKILVNWNFDFSA